MQALNALDGLFLLVVLVSIWRGTRRGFLSSTMDLATLASSVLFAFWVGPWAAQLFIEQGWVSDPWAAPLAFIVLFAVARILLEMSLGRLLRAVPAGVHKHTANRALGVLPGAANGLLHAAILAMLLLALPVTDSVTRWVQSSLLIDRLATPAAWIEAHLRPIFDPAVNRTLNRLTVQPESTQVVKLSFAVQEPRPRPDLEAAMLALVNEERLKNNLRPLKPDPEASAVARAHSRDMFARSYFAHVTPDGNSPFDRMQQAGLRYIIAGENLALARNVPMAHEGLMNSPGHRANLLRPVFGRIGIGILDGGRYGLMVTQVFRN